MRDREKKVWCLNCEMQVMTEEQYNSTQSKTNDAPKQEQVPPPTSRAKPPVQETSIPPQVRKEAIKVL